MTELPSISSLYAKSECTLIHSTVSGLMPQSKQKVSTESRRKPFGFLRKILIVYGICSASWVQDTGGMVKDRTAGQLILMPGVLQIVALIKCCMRQIEWIWSQPLMVRLITAAGGVVYSGQFARSQDSVNTRGGYCSGTVLEGSPYAFPLHFCMSWEQRLRICPGLFSTMLVQQTVLKTKIVSAFRPQGRFAYSFGGSRQARHPNCALKGFGFPS